MKTRLIVMLMLVVMFTLPAALYAQETDAATVIKARIEVMNAGDAEAAAAFFATDATYKINDPPPGPGSCIPAEMRSLAGCWSWWRSTPRWRWKSGRWMAIPSPR